MSKARHSLDRQQKLIRGLSFLVLLLLGLVIHAHVKISNYPTEITFYTPPDLSLGGQAKVGQVPETSAFNFAFTMFGSVNTWRENGAKDYPENIKKYANYFSTGMVNAMQKQAEDESSNNRGRVRTFTWERDATPALSRSNGFIVEPKGNNSFYVTFAARVVDDINGYDIKDQVVVYHLVVSPKLQPRHINPWQMEISGKFAESERL